ncbi:hypothetical protein EDB86DRAFT_3095860 [Lactarius hatsudake]|nr:hypothetical protein EDB86DRAFT_3095860 [Lactarius hatsudake]
MSSQFYSQFYAAAIETAIYAELWIRTRAGNHEASPGPTLRDILFPTQYTTPETPPPPFEETDTTAVESDTLPFANQTIVTEVRERPTEPQDHPGEGWRFNHPKTKRAYPFMIRRNGNLVRAKYIQYKRGQRHPMIEGTMGSGQTIYEAPLRAHDIDKHLPLLTPPQIRIFDYDTAGRPYVDRALATIDDWPLTAEVKHYRTFNSVWRMSQNNIYQRVQTVIQREDDHDLWVSNADLRVEMQYARELPDSIPAYATKFGHRGEHCYHPHRNCHLECLVPRDHRRYSHPCRLRPVPDEDEIDETFRRRVRRDDRLRRRAERRTGP